MVATVYRIKAWEKHFENNRTKELKKLSWVPFPNKHDGDGFTELVDHQNGAAHYGAWCILVQVASKCDPRGTLLRDTGKGHDSQSLARMSHLPATIFEEVLPRLLSMQWIETYDNPAPSCGDPAPSCASRARAEWNGMEGNGIEGKEKKPAIAVTVPETLNTPEFLLTWEAWKTHLKEKKSKTTPSAFKKQLEKCATLGILESIRWINYAIEHSWHGLYEPTLSTGKSSAAGRPLTITELNTQLSIVRSDYNRCSDSEKAKKNALNDRIVEIRKQIAEVR